MSAMDDADVVMQALQAVERRERDRLTDLYHPEIEFRWPPGLPYSGSFKGAAIAAMSERFAATWLPLQPTPETRHMEARVVAAGAGGRVIVNYLWKGLDVRGRRFATETLADYQVRNGQLARAQMFYFDLPGMIAFLNAARTSGDA